MKNLIVLAAGLLISTGVFAKPSITCEKQATVAAQGLAKANPGYNFGKVTIEAVQIEDSVTTYRFRPSQNDGYIDVQTVPSTATSCYVFAVNLVMP